MTNNLVSLTRPGDITPGSHATHCLQGRGTLLRGNILHCDILHMPRHHRWINDGTGIPELLPEFIRWLCILELFTESLWWHQSNSGCNSGMHSRTSLAYTIDPNTSTLVHLAPLYAVISIYLYIWYLPRRKRKNHEKQGLFCFAHCTLHGSWDSNFRITWQFQTLFDWY